MGVRYSSRVGIRAPHLPEPCAENWDAAEDLARKLEQAGAGVEVRASSYGSSYW
jgi:hypothetical protein